MFSRGNRVIHESYPGTVFEFQNYEGSNECWIYYLDGNFEVDIAEPILVYVEDITKEQQISPKASTIYLSVEDQIRELEEQHQAKQPSQYLKQVAPVETDLNDNYDWSLSTKRSKKSFSKDKSKEGRDINEKLRPKYVEELEAYHRELRGY